MPGFISTKYIKKFKKLVTRFRDRVGVCDRKRMAPVMQLARNRAERTFIATDVSFSHRLAFMKLGLDSDQYRTCI